MPALSDTLLNYPMSPVNSSEARAKRHKTILFKVSITEANCNVIFCISPHKGDAVKIKSQNVSRRNRFLTHLHSCKQKPTGDMKKSFFCELPIALLIRQRSKFTVVFLE